MAQHTYRHRAAEILGFVEQSAGAAMKLPRIVRQMPANASSRRRRSCAVTSCPRPTIGCSAASMKRATAGSVVGRMACGAHGCAAGTRLSRPDRRHEARRTAARFHGRGRSRRGNRHRPSAAARGRLRQRLLFGSVRHAASRRRPLHRHRLFGRHDRPRPRALSVDGLRGRRRDPTALRRRAPSTSSSTAYR